MMKTQLTPIAAMMFAAITLSGCSEDTEYVYVCDDGTEVGAPEQCPITEPGDPTDPQPPVTDAPFVKAAQADIDEAYISILSPEMNMYDPTVTDWELQMPNGYQAKRTAAYPWGTTTYKDGDKEELWFGTIAQGWCVWPYQNIGMDIMTTTYESQYTACSIPNTTGTPSQFYVYNFESGEQSVIQNILADTDAATGGNNLERYLEDFTPRCYDYGQDEDGNTVCTKSANTFGFRASGTVGDLVFTAGHYKDPYSEEGRLRLFVFNAKERSYVGSRDIIGDTTRRFRTLTDANGNEGFYTIIGSETGMTQKGGSPTQLLRWVGTQDDPFAGGNVVDNGNADPSATVGWEIVSDRDVEFKYGMIGDWRQFTDADGNDRVLMSSAAHPYVYKPEGDDQGNAVRQEQHSDSVILISNVIPEGGFTADKPMEFTEVFNMNRYDADDLGGSGAKWGTSAILDGYVYFGTYHQGNDAGYSHFKKASPALHTKVTEVSGAKAFQVNQWRASSIFRMKITDLMEIADGKKDPELLYGYENFEVAQSDGSYKTMPNRLDQKPLYGAAGMGNPGNVYSWTSVSKDGQLFWGFFDAFSGMHDLLNNAYAGEVMIPGLSDMLGALPNPDYQDDMKNSSGTWMMDFTKAELEKNGMGDQFVPGGDLVVFESHDKPARVLTNDGFGNLCSNGIRNVVEIKGELYFGTSTWCNLSELGGLEFYKYVPEMDK